MSSCGSPSSTSVSDGAAESRRTATVVTGARPRTRPACTRSRWAIAPCRQDALADAQSSPATRSIMGRANYLATRRLIRRGPALVAGELARLRCHAQVVRTSLVPARFLLPTPIETDMFRLACLDRSTTCRTRRLRLKAWTSSAACRDGRFRLARTYDDRGEPQGLCLALRALELRQRLRVHGAVARPGRGDRLCLLQTHKTGTRRRGRWVVVTHRALRSRRTPLRGCDQMAR